MKEKLERLMPNVWCSLLVAEVTNDPKHSLTLPAITPTYITKSLPFFLGRKRAAHLLSPFSLTYLSAAEQSRCLPVCSQPLTSSIIQSIMRSFCNMPQAKLQTLRLDLIHSSLIHSGIFEISQIVSKNATKLNINDCNNTSGNTELWQQLTL